MTETVTPTSSPTGKVTPTTATAPPTPNPTQYFAWATYKDTVLSVSFEYPLYFSLAPYSDEYGCAPSLRYRQVDGSPYIRIGGFKLWTDPFDVERQSLADYAQSVVEQYTRDDSYIIDHISWSYVDGLRSVRIDYRNARNGQLHVETFFIRGRTRYTLDYQRGLTCDLIAEQLGANGLTGHEIYDRILATLDFLD